MGLLAKLGLWSLRVTKASRLSELPVGEIFYHL